MVTSETTWTESTADFTETSYSRAADGIWLIGSPILLVLGSVGNILSIAVMTRRSLRETTARLLLIILAFADLLNLYSGLLRHWVRVAFGVDVRELSNASCKIHIYVVYFAVHFESWLLVIITIERFVAVFFPHKSRIFFTQQRAVMAVSFIAVVLLLLNAHFFWTTFMAYDELGGYCDYKPFFDEAWVWIDLFLASLGPFAVMITLNCAIAYKLHQHRKYRREQCVSQRPSEARQSRLTIMLLSVSVTFFITTLPLCIHLILVNGIFLEVTDPQTIASISLSFAICSILAYTNNSINFFLYCMGGQRFRRELVGMCSCRCCHKGVEPDLTVTGNTGYPSDRHDRYGSSGTAEVETIRKDEVDIIKEKLSYSEQGEQSEVTLSREGYIKHVNVDSDMGTELGKDQAITTVATDSGRRTASDTTLNMSDKQSYNSQVVDKEDGQGGEGRRATLSGIRGCLQQVHVVNERMCQSEEHVFDKKGDAERVRNKASLGSNVGGWVNEAVLIGSE